MHCVTTGGVQCCRAFGEFYQRLVMLGEAPFATSQPSEPVVGGTSHTDVSPRSQLWCCREKAAVGAILMYGTAGERQRRHVWLVVEDLPQCFRFPVAGTCWWCCWKHRWVAGFLVRGQAVDMGVTLLLVCKGGVWVRRKGRGVWSQQS